MGDALVTTHAMAAPTSSAFPCDDHADPFQSLYLGVVATPSAYATNALPVEVATVTEVVPNVAILVKSSVENCSLVV